MISLPCKNRKASDFHRKGELGRERNQNRRHSHGIGRKPAHLERPCGVGKRDRFAMLADLDRCAACRDCWPNGLSKIVASRPARREQTSSAGCVGLASRKTTDQTEKEPKTSRSAGLRGDDICFCGTSVGWDLTLIGSSGTSLSCGSVGTGSGEDGIDGQIGRSGRTSFLISASPVFPSPDRGREKYKIPKLASCSSDGSACPLPRAVRTRA